MSTDSDGNGGGHREALAGGGEMGALMRAMDWSSTGLGPVDTWPQSLRPALSICLGSRFPIAIYWGAQLALLYNDAWSPMPGTKHRGRSAGRRARSGRRSGRASARCSSR